MTDPRPSGAYSNDDAPDDWRDAPAAPRAGGIAARAMGTVAGAAPWLENLNPEQRQAVETTEGPLLVLAGAGTGKTRVLTARIAHILATGRAFPSQILSVTFTNKAAREMKKRVASLIGEERAEGMPWLGTFHSIGVKILRRHAEMVDLRSDFTDPRHRRPDPAPEADRSRRPTSTRSAGRRASSPPPSTAGRTAASRRTRFPTARPIPMRTARAANSTPHYQARLKTLNAADFGDLLTECLRLFRERPDVLADFQKRFRYMLVDEYQDTNVAQYLWLRLLAQGNQQHLLRRRRRPVDLRLARRGGRQHPPLRARFSRRRR